MKDSLLKHKGMADASAGVHISGSRFIVASDESNVFEVFDAKQPGRFLQKIALSDVLDIDDDGTEADLEGSAKIGDVTFWVSSHSRDEQGNLTLGRHRFFATKIKGNKSIQIKQIGKSYTNLATDLMNSPIAQWTDERLENEQAPRLTKTDRSLNIEGLAAYNGSIVLGFRSPLTFKGEAIILPVHNPLEMIMFGAHAIFGEPILLDLGGRGIRSIDYWEKRKCYLICANEPGSQSNPAFFLWTGKRDGKAKQLHLPQGANELTPEGVVFLGRRRLLILSDDGKEQKEQSPKKKSFRSLLIKVS